MALTQDQLNKIKSNYNNGTTVERIGRITLGHFLAKYAGKSAVFDEYTNRDEVQFTFYWSQINVAEFMEAISKNPRINKQMSKAFFDNLFKYSNRGEQLIYSSVRRPLPEVVTYDPSSSYALVIDLLHAQGTDKESGQPFSKYYTKVLNVLPQRDENNQYLTFTENDMKAIPHENEKSDGNPKIENNKF